MSSRTSPPDKISPANAPPCSSTKSLWLQTTMGERVITGEAIGEGEIKGEAVDCPDSPEHTSSRQTSNSSPANIPPNPSRESSPLGMIMGEGGIEGGAMGEGTMAETEGGGDTTRDDGGRQWTMTMDDGRR